MISIRSSTYMSCKRFLFMIMIMMIQSSLQLQLPSSTQVQQQEDIAYDIEMEGIVVIGRTDEIHNYIQQNDNNNLNDESYQKISLSIGTYNNNNNISTITSLIHVIEIISLPQYGILYDSNNTIITSLIAKNLRRYLIPIGQSLVTFQYQLENHNSNNNYFNYPSINAYGQEIELYPIESFQFRIRVYNNMNQQLIYISNIVTQFIHVIHVNHIGTLIVPKEDVIINPITNEGIVSQPIIYLDPYDYNIDYVRVDLWTNYGTISLPSLPIEYNVKHIALCSNLTYSTNWECIGNGNNDTNITFIAIPDDIPMILRYMIYTSFQPGTPDMIYIRVSDGLSNNDDATSSSCIDEMAYNTFMHRNNIFGSNSSGSDLIRTPTECYQIIAHINVLGYNVSDYNTIIYPNNIIQQDISTTNRNQHFFDFLSIADVLFWIFICSMIVLCTFWYKKLIHCLSSGSTINIEIDNAINDDDRYRHNNNHYDDDNDIDDDSRSMYYDHHSSTTVARNNMVI